MDDIDRDFHDASADFHRFLQWWIAENFGDLVAELKEIRAENNWLHGELDRLRVRGDY
jgi:hypothetical protein